VEDDDRASGLTEDGQHLNPGRCSVDDESSRGTEVGAGTTTDSRIETQVTRIARIAHDAPCPSLA